MKRPKHTPGPWTCKRRVVERIVRIYGPEEIRYEDGQPTHWEPVLAGLDALDVKITEQEANARLMAAAPELLEACQEASEFLHDDPNDESNFELRNLCTRLRAAIKKAESDE